MADATTPAEAPETPDSEAPKSEAPESIEAMKAELETWKNDARKHESRAKENAKKAKELDELHKQSMSEQERAIAEARDAALAEGRAHGLGRVVAAEMKAAAAGRIADVDALLEGLDTSKFLTDDGDVDTDAIGAWVDRIAPAAKESDEGQKPLTSLDLGQGSRSSTPIGDDAAFARMLENLVK